MNVLGLMSGTSMDGLDACLANLEINKNNKLILHSNKFEFIPFSNNLKSKIYDTVLYQEPSNIKKLHEEIGLFLLESTKGLLKNEQIDLISMHGQTISHINGEKTIQIGNPKYLYDSYNIPIIYDFRSFDIKLGGNGAPLMPFLDWMLYKKSMLDTITLNIGGISNVTYIPKNADRNEVIGFDTGPGMCLIDQYVKITWGQEIDFNAKYSKNGKINNSLLENLLENSFSFSKPPKSTSVENYNIFYLQKLIEKYKNIPSEDFIRTLVNYTVITIRNNIEMFLKAHKNYQLIISGGGINHPLIISDLKDLIDTLNIVKFKFNGIDHNYKEAFLMTLMGYCRLMNIPNNMPSVTGAKKNEVYGEIYE